MHSWMYLHLFHVCFRSSSGNKANVVGEFMWSDPGVLIQGYQNLV